MAVAEQKPAVGLDLLLAVSTALEILTKVKEAKGKEAIEALETFPLHTHTDFFRSCLLAWEDINLQTDRQDVADQLSAIQNTVWICVGSDSWTVCSHYLWALIGVLGTIAQQKPVNRSALQMAERFYLTLQKELTAIRH